MWFWRRLLRFPWTARRSNQSILKEINSEFSLEGLILKLKLQYFGHLMWRANSLEKPWCWERLRAGGEGGNRGWNGWMASLTQWTWIWVWANSGREWRIGKPGVLQSMRLPRVRQDLVIEQQQSATTSHNQVWAQLILSKTICQPWKCCRKAFPGPESGLLPNAWKWVVQGDTCADKAREVIGKGRPGGSSRIREPTRTVLPHDLQSWWWD